MSMIYSCNYINTLEALQQPTGAEGFVTDGHCNCAQCTASNTTVVADAATGDLFCPKDTRYCFEKDRDPATYSEERRALCRAPRSDNNINKYLYLLISSLSNGDFCFYLLSTKRHADRYLVLAGARRVWTYARRRGTA